MHLKLAAEFHPSPEKSRHLLQDMHPVADICTQNSRKIVAFPNRNIGSIFREHEHAQ
jgi:hypothetical protein